MTRALGGLHVVSVSPTEGILATLPFNKKNLQEWIRQAPVHIEREIGIEGALRRQMVPGVMLRKSFLLEFLTTASLRTHVWIWRNSIQAGLPAVREASQGYSKAHRTRNTSITSFPTSEQPQLRLRIVITHIRSTDPKRETSSSFTQRAPYQCVVLASSKDL